MYTVASPDHNPRGGGQLPNPNECNSTLTNGTKNIYPSVQFSSVHLFHIFLRNIYKSINFYNQN